MATTDGIEASEYNIETGYVKDGYIKYGSNDTLYDVSDLGYEEGTWLNIYINKDTKEVEKVEPRLSEYLVPKCEVHGICFEDKCCGRKPKIEEVETRLEKETCKD